MIEQPVAILIGLVNCLFSEALGCSKILVVPSMIKNNATKNAEMSMITGSK